MKTKQVSFQLEDNYSKAHMSGRVSELDGVTYEQLVRTFGEPNIGPSGDDKVQAEWLIEFTNEFDEKVIATVYDYKQYGTPVEEITYWSIGGFKAEAGWLVKECLGIL
jgi:hypothetical protein